MLVLLFLWFILQFFSVFSGNIAFLSEFATQSHLIFLTPFLEKLIDRGHNVTLIHNKQLLTSIPNLTIIPIEEKIDKIIFEKFNSIFQKSPKSERLKTILLIEQQISTEVCSKFAKSPAVQELVREGRHFDVVIATSVYTECAFPIAHLLGNHVVFLNVARRIWPLYNSFLGIPTPYSYVQHLTQTMDTNWPLNFWQRLKNVIISFYHVLVSRDYRSIDSIIQDIFLNASSIEEAHGKMSLVFSNSDPVLSEPVPAMPHVINIGGLHCRPGKKLPQKFQKVISEFGDNGFIVLSFGTATDDLGLSILKTIVDALARVKILIIWKTSEVIEEVPTNVKIFKWIPQQDLLAHPKIKLFITHGGVFGLQEAIYHGVPILGLPRIYDQFGNVQRMKSLGCGLWLEISSLTTESLYSSINEILENHEYKENIWHYSGIFKDQSESPLNRAVFWTEFLTTHDKLPFVENPNDHLGFAAYFCLDILLFTVILILGYFVLLLQFYKTVVRGFRRCFRKQDDASTKNQPKSKRNMKKSKKSKNVIKK